MNKNKQTLYRKIFAKKRKARWIAASFAVLVMAEYSSDWIGLAYWLNSAAPLAIDLGNGWIKCNSFGTIQDGIISYRPKERPKYCTALVAGIRLSEIKRIKII